MKNGAKRIVIINGCDFGSTGTISQNIIHYVKDHIDDIDYQIFVSDRRKKDNNILQMNKNVLSRQWNRFAVKVFGGDGFHNKRNTKKLIKNLKKQVPSLIHLHNLHGYYINMPILLDFIHKNHIPTIWTMHDNWIFTGRCAVIPNECKKYSEKCIRCSNLKAYPKAFYDKAHKFYQIKESILSDAKNIVFVSPSLWNKNLSKQSFLSNARIEVINNGIDLTIFHPHNSIEKRSSLNLENKFVIFCAAHQWSNMKGLDIINRLADDLDFSQFAIVMAGLTDNIQTHANIIRLPRIVDPQELSELYSMADVFLNPTRGDNFPTVDMEALASGTPVISFDTGGTKEIVVSDVGVVVPQDDYDGLKESIYKIYENPISKDKCYEYAKRFDKNLMLEAYLKLYMEMLKEG